MSHSVIVEFDSRGEALDFVDEVEQRGVVVSALHLHAYRPLKASMETEATASTSAERAER